MKSVIQRVTQARVSVNDQILGTIGRGALVFLSVGRNDSHESVRRWATQFARLALFAGKEGRITWSLKDEGLPALIVSQFTLHASLTKGKRPSFSRAAPPDRARNIYEETLRAVKALGIRVVRGRFGAHMTIELTHDGPVTLLLDIDEGNEDV